MTELRINSRSPRSRPLQPHVDADFARRMFRCEPLTSYLTVAQCRDNRARRAPGGKLLASQTSSDKPPRPQPCTDCALACALEAAEVPTVALPDYLRGAHPEIWPGWAAHQAEQTRQRRTELKLVWQAGQAATPCRSVTLPPMSARQRQIFEHIRANGPAFTMDIARLIAESKSDAGQILNGMRMKGILRRESYGVDQPWTLEPVYAQQVLFSAGGVQPKSGHQLNLYAPQRVDEDLCDRILQLLKEQGSCSAWKIRTELHIGTDKQRLALRELANRGRITLQRKHRQRLWTLTTPKEETNARGYAPTVIPL